MYVGVASEMLYRPMGKGWAVGADLNYVRQCGFGAPLTRDGGARLNRAYLLHSMTDGRDSELFYKNIDKITE